MRELLLKGGALMVPLLLCSIFCVALILDRLYHFIRARRKARTFYERMVALIQREKIVEACKSARSQPGPVAAVALAALERIGGEKEKCEEAVRRIGSRELRKLERYLGGLALLAQTAPLLGLLGTVTGMIRVFMRIEAAGGATNVTLLAGGLWEAMLTTAAGLIVAVPALVASHLFEGKVEVIAAEMKEIVSVILESRTGFAAVEPAIDPAPVEDVYGI